MFLSLKIVFIFLQTVQTLIIVFATVFIVCQSTCLLVSTRKMVKTKKNPCFNMLSRSFAIMGVCMFSININGHQVVLHAKILCVCELSENTGCRMYAKRYWKFCTLLVASTKSYLYVFHINSQLARFWSF